MKFHWSNKNESSISLLSDSKKKALCAMFLSFFKFYKFHSFKKILLSVWRVLRTLHLWHRYKSEHLICAFSSWLLCPVLLWSKITMDRILVRNRTVRYKNICERVGHENRSSLFLSYLTQQGLFFIAIHGIHGNSTIV